jgi:hypothetical protein
MAKSDPDFLTFLMPSYGRAARQPELINDAVYWFTRQDYPTDRMELLIVSDAAAAGQTVWSMVPGVRVVNVPYRFPSLGQKMNMMVQLALGDVILPCEDDDVSLPGRAAQAASVLAGHWDYWRPGLRFYHQKGREPVPDAQGCSHHASAYRKAAVYGPGQKPPYPPTSKGHDQAFEALALKSFKVNTSLLSDPRDITYVYRWGWSDLHLSAQPDMDGAYRHADPGPKGLFEIQAVKGDFDYANWHRKVYP